MISGIYNIRNLINNKIYIGSSKDIEYRTYRHLMFLRANKHINPHTWPTRPVEQIDKATGVVINRFTSLKAAAQYLDPLNIKRKADGIAAALRRKTGYAYGYLWK